MTIREVSRPATVPPAPLDRAGLDQAMLPFGQSRMLPKAAYLDEAVLAWERKHLFSRWLCLGRTDDVLANGRMRAFDAGRSSVLVVRGRDGTLRAFENACRHRGHELLPRGATADSGKAIVCPYHAWAYRHDGSMLAAPRFEEGDHFHKAEHGLFEVPLHDWHGWLWIDPSGQGGDFSAHVGALDGVIAAYDASNLRTVVTHEYDVKANWKVVVENYNECYHCPMIHPELCRVSPPHSGENLDSDGEWVGGWMELRDDAATMSLDGHSDGTVMAHLDEHEQRTVMYVAVLPNVLVSLHPDYVMTHLLQPVDADTTRVQCSWAFPAEVVERDGFDPSYAVDFWDITNKQDWAACESVQRGMKTPHFVPGPLANVEDAVYQFVRHMARLYSGTRDHASETSS
jgi:Rieske 2Fe-2S family protein